MKFSSPKSFYIVEAVCRPKKDGDSTLCGTTNNHTRIIRTWTFYSGEEFLAKRNEIISVCHANNARAYFLPQRRDTYIVLKSMMRNVLQNLDNNRINFNRLISSTLCGCHEVADSDDKYWVLDLDNDSMVERWIQVNFGGKVLSERVWTVDEVFNFVREQVAKVGKNPDDVYKIPTRNGWHIITPPFNLQAAQEGCRLMYEGNMKMPVKCECISLAPGDKGYAGSPGLDTRYIVEEKETTGWLHKDGMTLLYAPESSVLERLKKNEIHLSEQMREKMWSYLQDHPEIAIWSELHFLRIYDSMKTMIDILAGMDAEKNLAITD